MSETHLKYVMPNQGHGESGACVTRVCSSPMRLVGIEPHHEWDIGAGPFSHLNAVAANCTHPRSDCRSLQAAVFEIEFFRPATYPTRVATAAPSRARRRCCVVRVFNICFQTQPWRAHKLEHSLSVNRYIRARCTRRFLPRGAAARVAGPETMPGVHPAGRVLLQRPETLGFMKARWQVIWLGVAWAAFVGSEGGTPPIAAFRQSGNQREWSNYTALIIRVETYVVVKTDPNSRTATIAGSRHHRHVPRTGVGD